MSHPIRQRRNIESILQRTIDPLLLSMPAHQPREFIVWEKRCFLITSELHCTDRVTCFENLCFDLESKSFVLFPSPLSLQLLQSNSSVSSHGNYFSSIPRTLLVASPQVSRLAGGFLADILPIHSRVNVSLYYRLEGAWLASKTFNTGNFGKSYMCLHSSLTILRRS